ncbi:MAG: S1-like domain-containing RNA-binding protein [Desulfobacteraceae bacterium]
MLIIGSYNELVVERQVDFGFYLNPKEDEVLLPAKYAPEHLKPGDTITVFVYTDSEDRPVATTLTPTVAVGGFALLQVRDLRKFGAFLDWGLEKDLFLPAAEMEKQVKPGEKLVVKACLDEKSNRVYATSRIAFHCDGDTTGYAPGDRVDLLVFDVTDLGFMAVIDNWCCGMLYRNETFEDLAVGHRKTGFISRVRTDKKIDLTLKQPGYGSVESSSDRIIDLLEKAGGFIACSDKSAPDQIQALFSMSKKEFKRALGGLYKNRMVDIAHEGIRLADGYRHRTQVPGQTDQTPWARAEKKKFGGRTTKSRA